MDLTVLYLIVAVMAGLFGLALFIYARFVEPYRSRLQEETLETDDLPPGLDGLTILHLSDLHLKVGDRRRAQMIRQVSAVEADIVAITGDFIEMDEDIDFCVATLAGLRARHGVFAVLGNHDYVGDKSLVHGVFKQGRSHNDVQRLRRQLESQGIKVLLNESRPLQIGGQQMWVVGVDDPYYERHDLGRALTNVPAKAYKLLLAHSPEVMDQRPGQQVNLILCGHTHGGQIVLPLVGALVTRTRYPLRPASGWRRVGSAWMHISRGIGSSLPVRFRCPPEANLIQLKARPRVAVGRVVSSVVRRQR